MTAPQTTVRLIRHAESYEVRISRFFYHDDNAGRRAITGRPAPEDALAAAQAYARTVESVPFAGHGEKSVKSSSPNDENKTKSKG
jgi:hypothetical protein